MAQGKSERRGLGRGLSALMADVEPAPSADPTEPRKAEATIDIARIRPNPNQPRRSFDAADLHDLTESIREKGIIQPLILRVDPRDPDGYEIVAGERRWRAAQRAQLHEVPAIVRDFDDTEVLEVAIIENIQRADLSPVDEARGYRQLMDRFGHTQEKMAEALGKSRSYIANSLIKHRPKICMIQVRIRVQTRIWSRYNANQKVSTCDNVCIGRDRTS